MVQHQKTKNAQLFSPPFLVHGPGARAPTPQHSEEMEFRTCHVYGSLWVRPIFQIEKRKSGINRWWNQVKLGRSWVFFSGWILSWSDSWAGQWPWGWFPWIIPVTEVGQPEPGWSYLPVMTGMVLSNSSLFGHILMDVDWSRLIPPFITCVLFATACLGFRSPILRAANSNRRFHSHACICHTKNKP